MKLTSITLATVITLAFGAAQAQSGMKGMDTKDGHMGMKGMDMKKDHAGASGKTHKASGKVTKVDAAKGAITIAHGPVPSMNWPSMTMTFKAKDKAVLDKVKSGDQVEFSFTESGKEHTITEIR